MSDGLSVVLVNVQKIKALKTELFVVMIYTAKSVYKEPAYKELPVIRNLHSIPNLNKCTNSLYIYKEFRLL